jgi:hypothetical protein
MSEQGIIGIAPSNKNAILNQISSKSLISKDVKQSPRQMLPTKKGEMILSSRDEASPRRDPVYALSPTALSPTAPSVIKLTKPIKPERKRPKEVIIAVKPMVLSSTDAHVKVIAVTPLIIPSTDALRDINKKISDNDLNLTEFENLAP